MWLEFLQSECNRVHFEGLNIENFWGFSSITDCRYCNFMEIFSYRRCWNECDNVLLWVMQETTFKTLQSLSWGYKNVKTWLYVLTHSHFKLHTLNFHFYRNDFSLPGNTKILKIAYLFGQTIHHRPRTPGKCTQFHLESACQKTSECWDVEEFFECKLPFSLKQLHRDVSSSRPFS